MNAPYTPLLDQMRDENARAGVEFTIPGAPVAKGRPRFSTRGGFARTYTPKLTAAHEKLIADCARFVIFKPLEGALRLEVISFHRIPTSFTKAAKEAALFGSKRPATRPDIDNIGKLVLDALNKIAYADDNQVVELEARKFYGVEPRTVVRLVPV